MLAEHEMCVFNDSPCPIWSSNLTSNFFLHLEFNMEAGVLAHHRDRNRRCQSRPSLCWEYRFILQLTKIGRPLLTCLPQDTDLKQCLLQSSDEYEKNVVLGVCFSDVLLRSRRRLVAFSILEVQDLSPPLSSKSLPHAPITASSSSSSQYPTVADTANTQEILLN